jgi:hypothetical protein
MQPGYSAAGVLIGAGLYAGRIFPGFYDHREAAADHLLRRVLLVVALSGIPGRWIINGQYYYAQYVPLLFPLAFAALLYRLRGKKTIGLLMGLLGAAVLSCGCLLPPSVSGLVITALSALALLLVAAAGDWFSTGRARAFGVIGGVVVIAAGLLWLLIPADGYWRSALPRPSIRRAHPTGWLAGPCRPGAYRRRSPYRARNHGRIRHRWASD